MDTNVQMTRPMTLFEWALLALLSILFGSSFFFIGVAAKELPTFTIVVIRVSAAAVVLLIIMTVLGNRLPMNRKLWAAFFAMALLNNVIPFSLIVWGQSHIASGVAGILNASTPLFGVLVTHQFSTDEKMTRRRVLGIIVGFTGVIVMIGTSAFQTLGLEVVAPLAIVLATLSYAFASVFDRPCVHRLLPHPLDGGRQQSIARNISSSDHGSVIGHRSAERSAPRQAHTGNFNNRTWTCRSRRSTMANDQITGILNSATPTTRAHPRAPATPASAQRPSGNLQAHRQHVALGDMA